MNVAMKASSRLTEAAPLRAVRHRGAPWPVLQRLIAAFSCLGGLLLFMSGLDIDTPDFVVPLRSGLALLLLVSELDFPKTLEQRPAALYEVPFAAAALEHLDWARARNMPARHVTLYRQGCFDWSHGARPADHCVSLEAARWLLEQPDGHSVLVVLLNRGKLRLDLLTPQALRALMDEPEGQAGGAVALWRDAAQACRSWQKASDFAEALPASKRLEKVLLPAEPGNVSAEDQERAQQATVYRLRAQDYCREGGRWDLPTPLGEDELKALPRTEPKLKGDSKRVAIVFYVLEGQPDREKKFDSLLASLAESYASGLEAAAMHKGPYTVEVVIAAAPAEQWQFPERLRKLIDLVATLPGGATLRTPPTITKDIFPARAIPIMEDAWNCCGWTEYIKLGAWNLVEYDSVLMLDLDVRLYEPVDELFSNAALDFAATPDAVAALNGGFLWLRPSAERFQRMEADLREFDYDVATGWANTGPQLPAVPFFSLSGGSPFARMKRGVQPVSFATETTQGFLFWHFFLRGEGRSAMLDPCVYNCNPPMYLERLACDKARRQRPDGLVRVKGCHKGCRGPERPWFDPKKGHFAKP